MSKYNNSEFWDVCEKYFASPKFMDAFKNGKQPKELIKMATTDLDGKIHIDDRTGKDVTADTISEWVWETFHNAHEYECAKKMHGLHGDFQDDF